MSLAKKGAASILAIAALTISSVYAMGDSLSDFYKGRTVTLSVGSAAGSGFTLYARLIARHMPKYIPGGPNIIIENLPGAGGLRQMDHLVTVASKDGSVIGLLNPAVAVAPLLTPEISRHSPDKLAWLGSANSEVSTCIVWPHAKVNNLLDLKKRELVLGGSGATGSSGIGAQALKAIFGYPWKIIGGYQGSSDIMLAGARGEIDGACILLMSALRAQYWDSFKRGDFKVVLQMPPGNHPDLPGVANTIDLAETEEQREAMEFIYGYWAFGRPFAVPLGVPTERLEMLRSALKATVDDPAFLVDSEKMSISVDYMAPDVLEKRIKTILNTNPGVVSKVRALIPANELR